MKKSLIIVLVALFMFSTSIIASAKVGSPDESASEVVNHANEKIQTIIETTQAKSANILMKYETGSITLAQKELETTTLIEKMLTKTNSISSKAIKKALTLGFSVECTFVEVIIDGQIILVDPLFIVGT